MLIMETLWYIVVTLMLALYVVLDGFDFGVNADHGVAETVQFLLRFAFGRFHHQGARDRK